VHLLNFNVFSEPKQALWAFELRDGQRPDVVLDRSLQLNIVELPKADRLHTSIHPVLAQWVTYFQHWQEEHVMQQIEHPPIQQAYQRLHEISAERKAQFQALAREMALHDEATLREEREEIEAMRVKVETIRAETETIRAEAEAIGVARILRRQLKAKFGELSAAVEQQIQLADSAQLERWGERILTAATLEQVFAHH